MVESTEFQFQVYHIRPSTHLMKDTQAQNTRAWKLSKASSN